MFQLLTCMYNGKPWNKYNIIRVSSEEIFYKALTQKYIREQGKNSEDETLYVITEKGKEEYRKWKRKF